MKTLTAAQWLRAGALGFVCACAGFSYALATSSTGDSVSDRATVIGTNAVRPPVQIVTGPDLGLVVQGSQFTRQICVRFGFKPHAFTFGANAPAEPFVISKDGAISGIIGTPGETGAGASPTPEPTIVSNFDVLVTDNVAGRITTATRAFQLIGVPFVTVQSTPPVPLNFVHEPLNQANVDIVLPVAVSGDPYTFTVQPNGGFPQYTLDFASDQDFAALPLGLAFNRKTGEIFGKPLIPSRRNQPYRFRLKVTDSLNAVVIKTFVLEVREGTITSDFVATGGSFTLDFGREGNNDTLTLQAILNKTELAQTGIRDRVDLDQKGVFIFIGGVSLPPPLLETTTVPDNIILGPNREGPNRFNRRGELNFPTGVVGTGVQLPRNTIPDTKYSISLDPKTGVFKAKFTRLDLIKGLGANFSTFRNPVIPIKIAILTDADNDNVADAVNYDKTDVVRFEYRRRASTGRGSARSNPKTAPAGLFLINKVDGELRKTMVKDADDDSFTNIEELQAGTNPLDGNSFPGGPGNFDSSGAADDGDADDDNDGVSDVQEIADGTNPYDPASRVGTTQTQVTGTTVFGSSILTGVNSVVGIRTGNPITGPNIPSGTFVISVVSTTSLQLSTAAIGSGSGAFVVVVATDDDNDGSLDGDDSDDDNDGATDAAEYAAGTDPRDATSIPNVAVDRVFLNLSGFLRKASGEPVVPLEGDTVDLLLNEVSIGSFPATSLTRTGDRLTFFNTDSDRRIKALIIDGKKGTVEIQTYGLDPRALFGQDFVEAGDALTLTVTVTIRGGDPELATFDGQGSTAVFRKGTKLKNK